MSKTAEDSKSSLDDLYAWIDTIPMSRPKRSIARDFADGVLVAEVIAHFLPRMVELHNYNAASSLAQKKVNWQTLNKRVFSKMGMRINDQVVAALIEAKPGIIEKVLWDIRGKIEQLSSNSEARLSRSTKPSSNGAQRNISSPASYRAEEPQLTYRVTTPRMASQMAPVLENSAVQRSTSPPIGSISPVAPSDLKNISPTSKFSAGFIVPNAAHQNQGYVAPPPMEAHSAIAAPILDKNENISFGGPPAQIIYRGHKMIPLQFLDDKEKEIKALESSNRSLTLKIHRLETLVTVKDQRIEDLTHQLQNLRSMYERVTETHFKGSL